MKKKKLLLVGMTTLLVGTFLKIGETFSYAEEVEETSIQQQPEARTLFLTARGSLNGSMVEYYNKDDYPQFQSGYIDLHYKSHDTGFVDGDYSYLTIELPQEFAAIAKQPSFKNNISGRVQRKGIMGDRWFNYNPKNIIVSGTQVTFRTPRELWFVHGEVNADISINYGAVQKKIPMLLIKDNYNGGYVFQAALRRSMAPWDPIQNPIIGTNNAKWKSDITSAYWD